MSYHEANDAKVEDRTPTLAFVSLPHWFRRSMLLCVVSSCKMTAQQKSDIWFMPFNRSVYGF